MMRTAPILVLALAGCASHTAQIAASANDVRSAATSARAHLDAASAKLELVEAAAANVTVQVGYVSDDASPIVESLRYGSYIAGALALASVVYFLKSKI